MKMKTLCCIFLCLLIGTLANKDQLDSAVKYQCIKQCSSIQNRTENTYDYVCDYNCNIDQCKKGCNLWRKALNSSCQKTCDGKMEKVLPTKIMYCVMGCNDAMTKYFQQVRVQLGTPPAPALVADSLKATSLKLEWNFPEARREGLACHVQWMLDEISEEWQYCTNVIWNMEAGVVSVNGLHPYTKYRFRIAIILDHHRAAILSPPSVVISTAAQGVPMSPPNIVRAVPVDYSSISVSWEPGPFPHGPLLSYVLQITDNHTHSEVKDIPPDIHYCMLRDLKPQTTYKISICMRNNNGSGPPADVFVETPVETRVDKKQPVLILCTEDSVIEQLARIGDEPVILYTTNQYKFKGMGIHINKTLIFLSDSAGRVLKMSLSNSSQPEVILQPSDINFLPLDISVDWLNDQLYILGEVKSQLKSYQIVKCSLSGKGVTVAIAGLNVKPLSMEVDPYNGYLFWIIQDKTIGGLYSLDLADISNGIKHEIQPKMIINNTYLGSFVVDYPNLHLFVAYPNQTTIKAVSLDGKEITNIRAKVTNSKILEVVSLAYANKKFYWSDGVEVFFEDYHSADDNYFHNSIPLLPSKSKFKKVFANTTNSQPIPVPLNPPTNVQAIFGCDIAKTKWLAPHLLGVQSMKGAWQNWSYVISITEIETNKVKIIKNINITSYTITGLKENTEYIIKAAAYTSSGNGPWSSEFRGITLRESNISMILWSAAEGLLKSDAVGESVDTIMHKSKMKNFHVIDITWYKDKIYLVSNNSDIVWYNITSHKIGKLIDVDVVGSIAIDWIGKKMYWSNPKQQLIFRGNLNGSQKEHLPFLTVAKELNIDAVKGYLYWSTGYAVECSHLNGEDRREYQRAQFFPGKQVLGLTLDMDSKYVFWIVQGSEGSNLFRAPMAGYGSDKETSVEKVSTSQKPNMQGPLCYFHKRFLWLQDDKNAAISDMVGKNVATISSKSLWGLNMVYVIDSSLHLLPENYTDKVINVIPEGIDKTSVKVVGSHTSFNITWKPVENVNYGKVFYEIQIDSLFKNYSTMIIDGPSIKYWQKVPPHTKLHISLRAYTYWGFSQPIQTKIYSPSSTPSAPINLRTYVVCNEQYNKLTLNKHVSVTFRWDPPLNPNGEILGYKVYCWYKENEEEMEICNKIIESPTMEYTNNELLANQIYYFQVQAYTMVGDGILSSVISVNSSNEWPIPTLLIATTDSIFIDDIDVNQRQSLIYGIRNTPIEMAFLMKEKKVFWINQMEELLMYDLQTNKTRNLDILGKANTITLDWLERSLYYAETNENARSIIYKIDINQLDKDIENNSKIYETASKISKIEISPFTRKLYWVETDNGNKYKLMESNTDGTNSQPFFKNHNHNKRSLNEEVKDSCNCFLTKDVESSFTVDHSDVKSKPLLIFIDSNNQNVVSADKEGCFCNIIANNTLVNKSFPLDRIKSDFGSLYWTNPSKNLLFALKRRESNIMTKQVNVTDILIFGQHTQPYPPKECLSPKQHENLTVHLMKKTSNSLILEMPNFEIYPNCTNISMATVQYTIFYTQYNESVTFCTIDDCNRILTFDRIAEIVNLKPFTKYLISLAISNHFTKDKEMIIGPPVILKTAPGAPSKPQNVTATVLNPTLAEVNWSPPKELNGHTVHYEIHWRTEGSLTGFRQKGEQPVLEHRYYKNNTNILTTLLRKLSPNETYVIWVRAYSESNETSSDSEQVQITTYPKPSSFVLLNKTAYSFVLSWNRSSNIKEYNVEYAPITSNEWSLARLNKNDGRIYVENLTPMSQYKLRLSLLYKKYPELYIWPSDSPFIFETLGDKPSPPGTPIFQYEKPNVYKVWWEAAKDNGAPIEMYNLEGLKVKNYRNKRNANNRTAWSYSAPSIEIEERNWESFYNGTNTSWIIDGLSDKYKYSFRVSALNSYGWSLPSNESSEFDINQAATLAEKENPTRLIIIAICVPTVIVLSLLCFIYVTCWSCCKKPKKIEQVVAIPRGPDVELATLRELPKRGIHSTNILYVAQQPTSEEITLLPHIRRDQITLTKFLGSGAFGEVFEGKAKGIHNNNRETKVAIKTLRKGASDQEKTEFLQEAQLMSHFKHEHILQLLGVCLDNDPNFIIMELMQGGDLLTYLRSSRNLSSETPDLTLLDLLKMCVDVSKGCRYLEEMHFVHRDLACRNCLVSSIEAEHRIVKIGDFGLARDIYKNDYYRKEGEGLLPVRWMSPESLVDGVFTSQSDVWAFGVLLWEIMTLGQQPYPARNNLEVLHYVRRGGRLGKPTDCPEDLHNLMLKCWESVPENRPTFKYCLEILENLHQENIRNPLTGAHVGQYISTVPDLFEGISNAAYFRDENQNGSANSWRSEVDDDKEKTPFLNSDRKTEEIPKYLELIYERGSCLDNDGYEIPNQIIPKIESAEDTQQSSLKNLVSESETRNCNKEDKLKGFFQDHTAF